MVLKISHNYLKQPDLKLENKLTHSNFKRPLLIEALEAMEDVIGKFRVMSVDGKILGAAPRPENLIKATKLLAKLGKDYQYKVLIDRLSLPVSPVWENIMTLVSGGVSTTTKFSVPLTDMRLKYS